MMAINLINRLDLRPQAGQNVGQGAVEHIWNSGDIAEKMKKLARSKQRSRFACVILAASCILLQHNAWAEQPGQTDGFRIAAFGTSAGRAACSACHGQNGAGQPDVGIPRLAGLTATYIEEQLAYFASGMRKNYVMSSYATALTPAERHAVADYYAELPLPIGIDPITGDQATLNLGKVLFSDGDPKRGLLSCSQCHGVDGLGVGVFSPRLAGQSAAYIADQLTRWHAGDERDPKGQFMKSVAGHLDAKDIRAVAAYAASLTNQQSGSKP